MATAEVINMPNTMAVAPPESCMIAAEDLWKTYDMGSEQQVHALRGVNLRIQRNEYVAIMVVGFREIDSDEPDWLSGHPSRASIG